MKHIPPTLNQKSFHCPNCGVLAEQTWSSNIRCHYAYFQPNGQQVGSEYRLANYLTAKCTHCKEISIWLADRMVYPLSGTVEMAKFCDENGLPHVPIIDTEYTLPKTMEEMKLEADGYSEINPKVKREGFVYRSIDGQQSFKNVSREYLLKHNG